MALVDRHGRPLSVSLMKSETQVTHTFRKADPPKLGPAFGQWAGRDLSYLQLPGGAVLQFDLTRLRLSDFRAMRDHYQINASLFVLAAMLHQLDWHIECERQDIADQIESNLRDVWTKIVRAAAQAYWAGYSPCVLEFENDIQGRWVVLNKVKDLVPEDCRVHWDMVEGWAPPGHTPPKLYEFGGIDQLANTYPVPPENSLWYPLLMENGDYYGRKLLRPAFPSWFFSQLIHLFANRYFERFGEPLPIGRADFEASVEDGTGNVVSGKQAMEAILMNLRNRSVVVLPSDRDPVTKDYDYQIEYLESQMRGADFERYMTRLDEEMSLGLYTPILLFRTADVGSYDLGQTHMQFFQWITNTLAADFGQYLEDFPIKRLHDYNFGANAPTAYFRWRAQGKDNTDILKTIAEFTIRQSLGAPDLVELGNAIGMTFHEITAITPTATGPVETPAAGQGNIGGEENNPGAEQFALVSSTVGQITARLRQQVEKAWNEHRFGHPGFKPQPGYRRKFEETLRAEGFADDTALRLSERFFSRVGTFLDETVALGHTEFDSVDDFMGLVDNFMKNEVNAIPKAK